MVQINIGPICSESIKIEIKESLFKKVKPSGNLILSGILNSDLKEIKRQFTELGLTALEFHQIDEWIGIVLNKD